MILINRKRYSAFIFICLVFGSCGRSTVNNILLSGPWQVTISTNDVGIIRTVMQFDAKPTDGGVAFDGYTEKGADQVVLGFWKSRMARMFTSNFKHGSIIYFEESKLINNDSIVGILNTPFGSYAVNTKIVNGTFTATLKNKDGSIAGSINGVKGQAKIPLSDYTQIIKQAIDTTAEKLYDPALLQTPAWKQFTGKMQQISTASQDDATFILGFFYYSHKLLPFSHFNLYRPQPQNDTAKQDEKYVHLIPKDANTVDMQVVSFAGGPEEMDSAFDKITSYGYKTLIVDLRDNAGGSVKAGMAFIHHLVSDTLNGGIFLTKKYFADHTAPPKVSEYTSFPSFSSANYDLLLSGISTYPGILLKAVPHAPVFKGKIYVLVNSHTASTCEPIVYLLKQYKLAAIVGEKTAGAMLNGEHFNISDGFVLTVPTATYFTADGFKIDGNGVAPDITIKSASALDTVMKILHR